MDYEFETTTGEKIKAHSAPYSTAQIDELLGRVLNEDVGGGVFWAEYGVTTAAEIITAANAGKLCVVSINGTVYVLAYTSGTSYARFAQTSSYLGNSTTTTIECSGSSWRSWTVTNEMTSDKVQAISSEDATSKYPSSPAVQAYVKENASLYVYHTSGPDRLPAILAAHEAGRPCVLIDDTFPENGFYQLHSIDSQKATFVASPTKILNLPAGDRILSVPFYIVYENGASGSYYGAELYANKVQKITEADTSALYPSSPAVQEYVAPVKNAAFGAYVTPTAAGAVASFDDGADGLPVKSLVVDVEPVQAGTGDPSPDNVRSITGWTGAKVTRTGKNILSAEYTTNPSGGTSHYIADFVLPKKGQIYTCSATADDEPINVSVCAVNYIAGAETIFSLSPGQTKEAPDLTSVTQVEIFTVGSLAGKVIKVQTELGSTATAYEPYRGDTSDISFPGEAGTVYGGTLNVTSGVLTVDRSMWDLGTLFWSADASRPGVYYTNTIQNQLKPYSNVVCSQYAFWPSGVTTEMDYYISLASSYGTGYPYIRDTRFAGYTGAEVNQALSGVQAVFELATPLTYQLDPIEVKTLLGVNNIYADTGDTEVTYRADPTKIYDKIMNALLTMTGGN